MKIKIILLIFLTCVNFAFSSGQKDKKKVQIMGIVSDVMKRPVVGALVLVDGKRTNALTNSDGVFKIKVPSSSDSITIFAARNRIQTVPIMGRTRIDFVFDAADASFQSGQKNMNDDNQIDIGYGTLSQKNLLTPVSILDGRGNKYASYRNIYEILKGTPGVVVRGTSIQIDGPTSMYMSTEPLFVIDGMAVGSIEGITPVMVESISVLKGSSTAIYGSRGANGVILISLYNGTEKRKNK